MTDLTPGLFQRLTQLLMPYLADTDEREAWLTQAFFLREPRLFNMDRTGSNFVFTTRCIKTLLDFGCFTEPIPEHALAVLLNTMGYAAEPARKREFEDLATAVNRICQQPAEHVRATGTISVVPETSRQSIETPVDHRRPTVFMSYSHRNEEFANRLIADLEAGGHAVWIDHATLKGGDHWIRAISEGIINSYAFVLIASKYALESIWVQDEITWAKQKGKPIFPVLLEDVVSEVGFFPLVNYQGIRFYDTEYPKALKALFESLPSPYLKADETTVLPTSSSGIVLTQRALELQYLDRLRFEILLNTEKYTSLAGTSQTGKETSIGPVVMRPELVLLSDDKDSPQEVGRFDNAVEEILALRRVVVLGEPGAGKTTTLWKLARQMVDEAITNPKAPIPLLIRLARWTNDEQPLKDFIASELGALGKYLDQMLVEKRAALLLDGLNEIPVAQRRANLTSKDKQIGEFIRNEPDLLAAVTCREQDYILDLGFDRVRIAPLDAERILEFTSRYLGAERGEKLFWQLAGNEHLKEVWFKWRMAGATLKQFWESTDIPYENPPVNSMTSNTDDKLWQEYVRNPGGLMALAHNPYLLWMLTKVYEERGDLPENRGELFHQFILTLLAREKLVEIDKATRQPIITESIEALLQALAELAYTMQLQRNHIDEQGAVTALSTKQAYQFLDEQQLYQAGSASILNVAEMVRFNHQLLQEYFVATAMRSRIETGSLKASDLWPRDRWWERTNWEEAAILLAGLYSNNTSPVLNWMADANPLVTAQCMIGSGAKTPEITQHRLQALWLSRLTALSEPIPGRAAVGQALAITHLDIRPGVGLQPDGLPNIDWVVIPGGAFLMGRDRPGEKLQHTITLAEYRISRYPITTAQFRAFVDASNGFANPAWWNGLAANHQHRSLPVEQTFEYYNNPCEYISWWDAVAFCRWLSAGLGYTVRLPSEAEWEKAARGTDGRLFPYGNSFDPSKGNTNETGVGRATVVGMFPDGTSPYGVLDMSGNVWEWCSTIDDSTRFPLPYTPDDGRESQAGTDKRVLRGGSWYDSENFARTTSRYSLPPISRFQSIGFRVVCEISP